VTKKVWETLICFILTHRSRYSTSQKSQRDYRNDNVKSLEAEHRGGNDPKMGQSSTEDEKEELLDAE